MTTGGVRALALVGCAAALTACTAGPHGHRPSTSDGRVPVDTARVGLTEWAIVVPAVRLRAGPVTLSLTNAGATAHDLVIHGAAGQWRSPVLAPGERAELRVEAIAGERLHLFCDVWGHHRAGMHAELPVAGREAMA